MGGLICSHCCGAHRCREIACPPDCPYLSSHEAYQRDRLGETFFQARQPLHRSLQQWDGEKALLLLRYCDVALYQLFQGQPAALDAEIFQGLEYLRRRLSPIATAHAQPALPRWDTLREDLQAFCREREISGDLALKVLDRLLEFSKAFSGSDLRSRRYLTGFLGFFEATFSDLALQIKGSSAERKGRLILPGEKHGSLYT